MKIKKMLAILLGSAIIVPIGMNNFSELSPVLASDTKTSSITTTNKQIYQTADNKTHQVAWLKGVDAPLMSGDDEILKSGNPDYFYHDTYIDPNTQLPFDNFKATFQPNKGYFDLNKDIESRPIESTACYLVSASNSLLWWLKNNESLVKEYLNHLANDDAFGYEEGLRKLLPYNPNDWNMMFETPGMITNSAGLEVQSLAFPDKVSFATKYFPMYYNRTKGLGTDVVIDFFINGYYSMSDFYNGLPPVNSEDNYRKDKMGGWFHPIFGKTLLTERHEGMKFEKFNSVIKDALNNDKAIQLSFYTPSKTSTHAISVWGAEFDENENIVRIFITDGDDYNDSILEQKTGVGLISYEVIGGPGEAIRLSSDIKRSDENQGSLVQFVSTLSLSQDLFRQRLDDLSAPKSPFINTPINKVEVAKGGSRYINIETSEADAGYLTYQWYVSDDKNQPGVLLDKQTSNKVKVNSNNFGTKYYYCMVANHKNGKVIEAKSDVITVEVIDAPLVDAATPNVRYNSDNFVEYEVGEQAKALKAIAKVSDNGTLTYQWYRALNSYAINGTIIKGATDPILNIQTNSPGNFYYYCVVTNTNLEANGKQEVSATSQYSIRICVRDFAYNWAVDFLNANICGTDDLTKADPNKFKDFEDLFNDISKIKDAKHSINYLKNVKSDQLSSDVIKKALAKYDRIIYLHGEEGQFNDFLNRRNSQGFSYANENNLSIANTNDMIAIIVISSMVFIMVSGVVSFYILKKKHIN